MYNDNNNDFIIIIIILCSPMFIHAEGHEKIPFFEHFKVTYNIYSLNLKQT